MSNEEKIMIRVEEVLERLDIDIEEWHAYNELEAEAAAETEKKSDPGR